MRVGLFDRVGREVRVQGEGRGGMETERRTTALRQLPFDDQITLDPSEVLRRGEFHTRR